MLERALELVRARLPPGWAVELAPSSQAFDARFVFYDDSGVVKGGLVAEARAEFKPADVDWLVGRWMRHERGSVSAHGLLLVSDFLSPRARQLLAAEGASYVDATGNMRLVMSRPALFVETQGAQRRPTPRRKSRSESLRGATTGRIVRFLSEVEPPYGVTDIAAATGISQGWVSRVLDRLVDEALIERKARGPVEAVRWPDLLRARGESVDLFRAHPSRTYIAPNGARPLVESLAHSSLADGLVVTGSFAAARTAPVAAATLLVAYLVPGGSSPSFERVAEQLRLLPADEAPDVVLLRPTNPHVVGRPRHEDGLAWAGLPQVVMDCFGGSGRMPAEGQALLEWMEHRPDEWRYPSLEAYLESVTA